MIPWRSGAVPLIGWMVFPVFWTCQPGLQARGPLAEPPGPAEGSAGESAAAALAALGAQAERIVLLEVAAPAEGGKERVLLSLPAVVLGPRTVAAIAPRLAVHLDVRGAEARISKKDQGGTLRRKSASLVRADHRTGLAILQTQESRRVRPDLAPAPCPQKDSVVILVEQGPDGRPFLRRGHLRQPRVYLDQGRGQNPLLLAEIPEALGPGRSFARMDDDLSSPCGALICDASGGFLGLAVPPDLGPFDRGGKEAPAGDGAEAVDRFEAAAPAPGRRPGEILVLPAEVVHYLAENLSRDKAPARGYLGASLREVPRPPEEVLKLGASNPGIRVDRVVPGGPAEKGGLKAGDWLVAIAEKRPVTYPDVLRFSELVEYGGQGRPVDLAVVRVGNGRHELLTLKIQIGAR